MRQPISQSLTVSLLISTPKEKYWKKHHMKNKENYYDEQIAPKLKALAKECESNGISLLAVCEWKPGEIGRTLVLQKESGVGIKIANAAAQANGNVDSLLMAIERYALEHGHNSIYLHQRGIPETPN